MDISHVDRWTRTRFTATAGRRTFAVLLSGLSAAAVGLPVRGPGAAAKKRKKKRKKKKVTFNAFGCVDVGKPCRGNDDNCCSGTCDGEKPKKGKKDTSRCLAHDVANCQPGLGLCDDVQVECGNPGGFCVQTTGDAGYCGKGNDNGCRDCRRDPDCEAEFGPGAACALCATCPETDGLACFALGA